MSCEECKSKQERIISEFSHEADMARMERVNTRLSCVLIVSVIALFLSNIAWLIGWMQFEYTVETESYAYTQDGEGLNVINNGKQGDVINGSENDS